jgi:hypothetical protein
MAAIAEKLIDQGIDLTAIWSYKANPPPLPCDRPPTT